MLDSLSEVLEQPFGQHLLEQVLTQVNGSGEPCVLIRITRNVDLIKQLYQWRFKVVGGAFYRAHGGRGSSAFVRGGCRPASPASCACSRGLRGRQLAPAAGRCGAPTTARRCCSLGSSLRQLLA